MWWQHAVYGIALLVSIFCMGLIDYRHNYAWFKDRTRTIKTVGLSVLVFVAWDIAGIVAGIFSDGDGKYRSGLQLGPHFPIEEILFLILLSYTSLIIWCALARQSGSRSV